MNRVAAAALLLMALFAAPPAEPAQFTIRVGVDLVDINFSVTDRRGRMVPNLTAEDFIVEEDGRPQHIVRFSRESELPLTLAILLDISPSVREVFREEIKTASSFIESILRPKDIALAITFDQDVTLVQDFTDSPSRLVAAIRDVKLVQQGTSFYDAVYLATTEKLAHEIGRKTVILISDGEDTTSRVGLSKAIIAAHRSNSIIYAIANRGGGSGAMRKLAEETGGAVFAVRRDGDFKRVFDQIALELRSQYSISYHSDNTARDGTFRQIRVIPRDSSLRVRTRRGYYGPETPAGTP